MLGSKGGLLFSPIRITGLGVLILAGLVSVGAYAFTTSNTVPASKAGSGSAAISGYTVSNVQYTNSGGTISAVQFNLDDAASAVSVRLSAGGSWHDCGASSGVDNLVSCTGLNESAASADQLSVTAVQ